MKFTSGIVVLLLLIATSAQAAHAGDWMSDPSASKLAFSGVYQGEVFDGRFSRFVTRIVFDPAQLAASKFDVEVTLASADTANSERDAMLKGAQFFNTASTPVAHYTATRFRSIGGNRYVADGVLMLRGVSKPLALTFTWTPAAKPRLTVDATINRLDFGVGGGEWMDTSAIGNAVKVHAVIQLLPRAAATGH